MLDFMSRRFLLQASLYSAVSSRIDLRVERVVLALDGMTLQDYVRLIAS